MSKEIVDAKKHIDLLGKKVKDKITGFSGVVASVSFDLYGCLQAWVTPKASKDGKMGDGGWFDVKRLDVTGDKPVMEVPTFVNVGGPEAKGSPSAGPR